MSATNEEMRFQSHNCVSKANCFTLSAFFVTFLSRLQVYSLIRGGSMSSTDEELLFLYFLNRTRFPWLVAVFFGMQQFVLDDCAPMVGFTPGKGSAISNSFTRALMAFWQADAEPPKPVADGKKEGGARPPAAAAACSTVGTQGAQHAIFCLVEIQSVQPGVPAYMWSSLNAVMVTGHYGTLHPPQAT